MSDFCVHYKANSFIYNKKYSHQANLSLHLCLIPSITPHRYPGDLPDSGIKPMSLVSPALAGRFFTLAQLGKPLICSLLRSNEDTLADLGGKKDP